MKTTFKDIILTELFDSKVEYEVTRESNRLFITKAEIEGREIVFTAVVDEHGEKGIEIDVEFTETIHQRNGTDYDSYALTGSGGEMKVFSMVGASLKDMANRYQPDLIHFTAEKDKGPNKEKRANLYEKLIKKFLPDYEIDKRDRGQNIRFQLYKK